MEKDIGNIKMLVVDDEPSIRQGIAEVINWEDYGISVVGIAENGSRAFDMAIEYQPHIIITDIKMPVMSGIELLGRLVEKNSKAKFLVISGYEDFSYAQQAIRYGVKDYLLKPFGKEKIINSVISIRDEILKENNKLLFIENAKYNMIQGANALKEKFFKDLIEGRYSSEKEIDDAFLQLDIKLAKKNLVAVVFEYVLPCELETQGGFSSTDSRLVAYSIINVLEELIGNQKDGVVFESGNGKIVALLKCEPGRDIRISKQRISNFCKASLNVVSKFIKLNLTVGIGSIAYYIVNIKESYLAALEAISYKLYVEENSVFDIDCLKDSRITDVIYPKDVENELIISIKAGDKPGIERNIDQFFRRIFYIPMPPPAYVKGISIQLADAVVKSGVSMVHDLESVYGGVLNRTVVDSFTTFAEFKDWIIKICLQYAAFFKSHNAVKNISMIEEAKSYIEKNILKKLTLEEVAGHVHMSASYFSSMFKVECGETFRDYVLELKVRKATELLTDNRIRISELSDLLGYEDYRSFNRAFKRIVGVCPSEYKDSLKRGE